MIRMVQVVGTPVPQGSTRAFSRGGKVFTTNDPQGTLAKWRGDIRTVAQQVTIPPTKEPVSATLIFNYARPKSHLTGRGIPRAGAPRFPAHDLDKLVRGVLDALTGIVYDDDSQVVHVSASKQYCDGPAPCPGLLAVFKAGEEV